MRSTIVLGLLSVLTVLSGCGQAAPACGPESCGGCCDAAGICQSATEAHCGQAGAACAACSAGQVCELGACAIAFDPTGSSGGDATSTTSGSSSATTTGGSSTTGSGSTTGGATSTSTSGAGSIGTSTGGAHAPHVQSLTADPTSITEGGTTIISAVVNDADGQNTLSGGTLTDLATGHVFGAFGTPGGQGTFQYALSWNQLQQLQPINFGPGGATHALLATFYDLDNNEISAEIDVGLTCGPTGTACSGYCHELSTDPDYCGTCAGTVPGYHQQCVNGQLVCRSGEALCQGSCRDILNDVYNCGGCGVMVPSNGTCDNGVPRCADDWVDCNGACVPSDDSNCGACGNSCDAFGQAHGATRAASCLHGMCVVNVFSQDATHSCDQLCAGAGTGLSCVPRVSCLVSGSNASIENACAWYADQNDQWVCEPYLPLGCGDLPPATIPSCQTGHGAPGPGQLGMLMCTCG